MFVHARQSYLACAASNYSLFEECIGVRTGTAEAAYV